MRFHWGSWVVRIAHPLKSEATCDSQIPRGTSKRTWRQSRRWWLSVRRVHRPCATTGFTSGETFEIFGRGPPQTGFPVGSEESFTRHSASDPGKRRWRLRLGLSGRGFFFSVEAMVHTFLALGDYCPGTNFSVGAMPLASLRL